MEESRFVNNIFAGAECSVVLFIFREEMYANDGEPRPDIEGVAEIIVGKQRNGPVGTARLAFLKQYTRFENLQARSYAGGE